jgi:hypothetical protein
MNVTHLSIALSAAQLVALCFFGVRVGYGMGERDKTLQEHGDRISVIEPKVEKLGQDVSYMRGERKAFAATSGG